MNALFWCEGHSWRHRPARRTRAGFRLSLPGEQKNLICKSGTRSVGLRASGYMRALVCASCSRPAASPRPARGQPLTGVSEAAGGAGRHLRQRLVSGCQALAGSKSLVRGTRGCRGLRGTHWPVTQSWPPMGGHEGSSQHAM